MLLTVHFYIILNPHRKLTVFVYTTLHEVFSGGQHFNIKKERIVEERYSHVKQPLIQRQAVENHVYIQCNCRYNIILRQSVETK